jgi:heat-inducible transcriptional repressor
MNKRRSQILKTLIKEHISTGAPVASSVLVNKYKFDISAATARNEMAWLENAGYIMQPHVSAGRIPTERSYQFFLEEIKDKDLKKNLAEKIEESLANMDDLSLKNTAKTISKISNEAVFWAMHKNNLFYTGISNLFNKPEFSQIETIKDVSAIIDTMEEIISEIFDSLDFGTTILIGEENPFGAFCSTIILKYKTKKGSGACGLLGPMRMNYEENIALVNYIDKCIKNIN